MLCSLRLLIGKFTEPVVLTIQWFSMGMFLERTIAVNIILQSLASSTAVDTNQTCLFLQIENWWVCLGKSQCRLRARRGMWITANYFWGSRRKIDKEVHTALLACAALPEGWRTRKCLTNCRLPTLRIKWFHDDAYAWLRAFNTRQP